jgi:hypothetical protein
MKNLTKLAPFAFLFALLAQVSAMEEEQKKDIIEKVSLNEKIRSACHIVCTPGAKDEKLKEILTYPEKVIVGLNLEMGYNLKDFFPLTDIIMTDLKYLKLRFCDKNVLKCLSIHAPNLEILDISNTNLFDCDALSCLSSLASLRVLDISKIPFSADIPEIICDLLHNNKGLMVYIQSFKKRYPKQDLSMLPDYSKVPQVTPNKYVFSSNKVNTIIY